MIPLPAPSGYTSTPGHRQGPTQPTKTTPQPSDQRLPQRAVDSQPRRQQQQRQQRQQQKQEPLQSLLLQQRDQRPRQSSSPSQPSTNGTASTATSTTPSTFGSARGRAPNGPAPPKLNIDQATPTSARVNVSRQQRIAQQPQPPSAYAVGGGAAAAQPQAEYAADAAAAIMSQRPEGAIVIDADFSDSGVHRRARLPRPPSPSCTIWAWSRQLGTSTRERSLCCCFLGLRDAFGRFGPGLWKIPCIRVFQIERRQLSFVKMHRRGTERNWFRSFCT